jgi:hypothetical protein
VVGRPGVISARYDDSGQARRASGRIADVLDAVSPFDGPLALGPLVVIGAPKDVLDALAERGIEVLSIEPLVTPAAAAAALAAGFRAPAASLH